MTIPQQQPYPSAFSYPLHNWLLAPYRNNGHLTQSQILYNFVHSSTRMVIESAFGMLKARFRRLRFLEMDDMKDTGRVIIVECTLHNVCVIQNDALTEAFEIDVETNNFQDIANNIDNAVTKRYGIKDHQAAL